MTITRIDSHVERLPLKRPFVTALRRVETIESLIVELQDDEGNRALGAAPPTVAITGESLPDFQEALERQIAPRLLEMPFDSPEAALNTLHTSNCRVRGALAAVDMALFGLAAARRGLPLHRMLGAEIDELETFVTISLDRPEAMLEEAAEALRHGFSRLKIKTGGSDGLDAKRIERIAAAFPQASIIVDANQAWRPAEASALLQGLNAENIMLIEQPVAADDLAGLQSVRRHSPFPVMADESAFDLDAVKRVVEMEAADVINIKLMKCGGIARAIEIAEYCQSTGVACMMGSMLEHPVSIAAAAAVALAYPQTIRYVDLDSPFLAKSLPEGSPVQIRKNRLTLR